MSEKFSEKIRNYGMRNFMLETELAKLEQRGIEIGHINTVKKDENVDPELFDSDIRKSAKRMADFYVVYFSLENSVRRLIKETLTEKYGKDWWEKGIPKGIKDNVKQIQEDEKDSVMAIRSADDPLTYTNFGELIPIIESQWDLFSDRLRGKKAMQQILSQFNKTRNLIAHSCELEPDEVTRLELLVKDWQRIQT
ncbi:Swt1 family HEPN domain-containing protein [Nitrosopumilus maritimus]|uniref:Swt1-like HEPN domain-containing protein n=1 Tax=Nitrosopumilus maritimus (strain SCM1) TaxID=436308 RepID=A9A382_NITMS|nr:Swt1 family HEPN domain-containing protein [Nitrosopumilus maritimus]ABX12511.1 conserved hypothetical protein [Nitrosopumilus maritimus SCM1]